MREREIPGPDESLAWPAERCADDRQNPIGNIETGKEGDDHLAGGWAIDHLDQEAEQRDEEDENDRRHDLLRDEFRRAMPSQIAADTELCAIGLLIEIDHCDDDDSGEDRAE